MPDTIDTDGYATHRDMDSALMRRCEGCEAKRFANQARGALAVVLLALATIGVLGRTYLRDEVRTAVREEFKLLSPGIHASPTPETTLIPQARAETP